MALEVYINDELIELKSVVNIGLTYQVGSILNLSGRSGNLSNKFTVPKTRINTRILGYISNVNTGSNIPYSRNSGRVVQNGVDLFPDGFTIVESSGRDFSLTIYSGNVSFFDLIVGKNVSILGWEDSCHIYDIPTIIASFTNNSDYIYPIVDWGDGVDLLNNTTLQNSNSLLPCLRMSSVLEKMMSNVGYELKGTFKDTDQFSRLLLTPNRFGFSDTDIANATGAANNVVPLSKEINVLSSCVDSSQFSEDNPIVYQSVAWESFNIDKAVFNNNYFGTFNFNVFGSFENHIPLLGEHIINSNPIGITLSYENQLMNEDYISYVQVGQPAGQFENRLILHEISRGVDILVKSVTGASVTFATSITETNGGYLAFSHTDVNGIELNLYEISTGNITIIYSDNTAPNGEIDYLEINNGKVAWGFKGNGVDGIWMYDILTGTTKNVTLSSDIEPSSSFGKSIAHNGDYLIWYDSNLDEISIYDYTLGTNSLIEISTGGSSIRYAKVSGDYFTYAYGGPAIPRAYEISTQTLISLPLSTGDSVSGTARTENLIAYGGQDAILYIYDLSLNTGGATLEIDAGIINEDTIDINNNYVAYPSDDLRDVRIYEISTGNITTVDSGTSQKRNISLGKTNVLFYTRGIQDSDLRYYNIDSGNFYPDIVPLRTTDGFTKNISNNRVLYNVSSSANDVDNRIAYINPINIPIEVNHTIHIKEDGVPIYSLVVESNSPTDPVYNRTLNTGNITVKSDSEYTVCFVTTAIRDETISYPIDFNLISSSFSFVATSRIPYGAKIDITTMYDWDQEKVLKDILNQYSLTIQTNEISKQVFLTPLDDLALNLPKARDWSQKIDLSKTPTIKFRLSGYGQRNFFNYQEDEDVKKGFGEGYFDIKDESLEFEKTIITLNSAAVTSGFRVVNNNTPEIPFLTGPGIAFEDKLARHLLLDPMDSQLDLKNTDNSDTGSTSVDVPFCYFKKSGRVDSLDFQSLLDDNYTVLQGMTDKIKFVSASFILKEIDVHNIDFTIPVYLDVHREDVHINGYFYINKISNFKNNKPTSVDLIRL